MKYREIKPNGFLTNFLHSFWEYETDETDYEHTIIPDGYFDLIAEFENDKLKLVKFSFNGQTHLRKTLFLHKVCQSERPFRFIWTSKESKNFTTK